MTVPGRAVFVVESGFLELHVGVRRVIMHYRDVLTEAGVDVEFARPRGAALERGALVRRGIVWGGAVDRQAADLVVVTTPWICPEVTGDWERSVGIVFDLVPNLLATGELRLESSLDVYDFAHQHARGFAAFDAHFTRVLAISHSTADDFRSHVKRGSNSGAEVVVDYPFRLPGYRRGVRRREVLLVNALDWRKNFRQSSAALLAAARRTQFAVTIVGRERVDRHIVAELLSTLAGAGIDVRWRPWVDDRRLAALYRRASVLLFPSRYEGLGYPILEAQAQGCPVISSNTSSCSEINLNPSLMFDPDDVEGMSKALVSVLDGGSGSLDGIELRAAQSEWLTSRSRGAAVLLEAARVPAGR